MHARCYLATDSPRLNISLPQTNGTSSSAIGQDNLYIDYRLDGFLQNPKIFCAVIPIADEISNGNFFNLLKDFLRQESQKFQILFVINNTYEDAVNNSPRFKANKQLGELIRYINKDPGIQLPDSLPVWQRDLVNKARNKELNLSFVHVNLGPEIDSNIEKARLLGLNIAKQLLKESALLTSFDADSRLSKDCFSTLIDSFNQDPELKRIQLTMNSIPTIGDQALFASAPDYRFGIAADHIANIILEFQFANLDWRVLRAKDYPNFTLDRISPRTYRAFASSGKRKWATKPLFTMIDRANNTGGGFCLSRLQDLQVNPTDGLSQPLFRHPISTLFDCAEGTKLQRKLIERTNGRLPVQRLNATDWTQELQALLSSFCNEDEQQVLNDCIQRNLRIEKTKHNVTRALALDFIEKVWEHRSSTIDESLIDTLYTPGSRSNFLLRKNPWLLHSASPRIQQARTKAELLNSLKERDNPCAEYFLDFDQTKFIKNTAIGYPPVY